MARRDNASERCASRRAGGLRRRLLLLWETPLGDHVRHGLRVDAAKPSSEHDETSQDEEHERSDAESEV